MSDLSSEREAVLLRAADLANAADAWANRMRGDRRSIVAPEHAYALGIITRAELEEARARAAAPQGYRCASCRGVAHPATGHQWTPKTLVCRGCAERFFLLEGLARLGESPKTE